jgi:ComF family protein
MNLLSSWLQDLSALFFPQWCPGCHESLQFSDELICGICNQLLPRTRYAIIAGNPVENIFIGRLPIEAAHSEFYFSKGQTVQRLMHQLKYKNNRKLGEWMGALLGESLLQSGRFQSIDLIVPLPMEKSKEKKRGYNQAEVIAQGVATKLKVPVCSHVIIKSKKTESQTKKDRTNRWLNIHDSFVIQQPDGLKNKNILLVDDVITTGATLDACGHQLLNAGTSRLYIATLATAEK